MNHLPATPPMTAPARPPAWLSDPLDDQLLRYWDGYRWSFHTAPRLPAVPAEASSQPHPAARQEQVQPVLRPDIVAALDRVRGMLVGSMKEVRLLADHLQPEEQVLALTGAQGEGSGVLACTDRRILFLFVGMVRKQFLQVNWNQAKAVQYNQASKTFAVYTVKPTKRATPALTVRVQNLDDAKAVAHAAQAASAAPRLDVV